jgi:MIP family channel proteins
MRTATWAPVLAEAAGTFTLIFAGAGSIIANAASQGGAGLLGIALAHGLAIAVMVSALGAISGGHFNPAVTCGFLASGRMTLGPGVRYIAAQLAGATLGAVALRIGFPAGPAAAVHLGTPGLATGVGFATGAFLEAIGTALLVVVVFGTAVHPQAPRIGGLAIGLVITMDILAFGPLTGAAVNPARAFGPALVANAWDAHLVYWIGPIVGGALAGWLYSAVFLREVR